MITTLNQIRSHKPCREGWEKLLRHLGKTTAADEPLPITAVLESSGLDDALYCLRAVEGREREIRLYVTWCARQVQHLMTDPRSLAAIDVAERFARGRASAAELRQAGEAALAAYSAAWRAAAAAEQAADAAHWAWTETAWAASAAESAGSERAARAAVNTAYTARQAGAAKAAQADELRRICEEIEAGRDPYPEEAQP
jgi:hypothetical protein